MILDTSKLLFLARALRADLIAYADRWHIGVPDQFRKDKINAKDEYQNKIAGRVVELTIPAPDRDLISNVVLALSEVFFQCESYLDGLLRYNKLEALPKKQELEDSHYDFYNTMTKRVDFLQGVIDRQEVTDKRMLIIIQRLKLFTDNVLKQDNKGKDALQFIDDAPTWMKFWMKDRHGEQMTSQYAADHLDLFIRELGRAENVYHRHVATVQRHEQQRALEAERAQEHANFEQMKTAKEAQIAGNKNRVTEIGQQLAACIVTEEQMTRLQTNLLYIVTNRNLPEGVSPKDITDDLQFEDNSALQNFQAAMRTKVDPGKLAVFWSSKPEDFVFVPETMHQIASKILEAIGKINTGNITAIQNLSQERGDLMAKNAELRTEITVEQLKQQHRVELLERDLVALQQKDQQAQQLAREEVKARPARDPVKNVGFFGRIKKRAKRIPRFIRRILLRRKARKEEAYHEVERPLHWPETQLHDALKSELHAVPHLAPTQLQVAVHQEVKPQYSPESITLAINAFIEKQNNEGKFPSSYKALDTAEKLFTDYYKFRKGFHVKRHENHKTEFRKFVKWRENKGKEAGDDQVEKRLMRVWVRLNPEAKSAKRRVAAAFSLLDTEKYTQPTFKS